MKKVVTRDYYIELSELREIIAKYFKEKTGETVSLSDIDVDIECKPSGLMEFKAIHISMKESNSTI